METTLSHPVFKFNPNVIHEIRQEYNLHQPGAMDGVIDAFEDWIKKQAHFIKKDFPRHYLETTLILAKGSLEKSKKGFDKLCTMKTLLPEFHKEYDVKNIPDFSHFVIQAVMPKQLKDNYRFYIAKIVSADFESSELLNMYKYSLLFLEYVKLHDYFKGFECMVDARDINLLNFSMKINIVQFKQIISIVMVGHTARIKAIHILSTSKTVDALVSIFKQVFPAKIAERIQVHKTLEELHECVPKEVLPKEYGGEEKALDIVFNNWRNLLVQPDTVEYLKAMCQSGTNEAFRQVDKYNEEILGMPGSFRSLTVD